MLRSPCSGANSAPGDRGDFRYQAAMTEPLSRRVAREVDDRVPPGACQTMVEVRQGVDALDRALVALLAERQGYMDAAARIKPAREHVRDEARIEDVLAKVTAAAAREGLSEAIAEPVWRLLVERCIAYEFEAFDKLQR
jgi:isochorismate pyruvate lyase